MNQLSDIEIAQQNKMELIDEIANKLNISSEDYEPYGHYKAKLNYVNLIDEHKIKDHKLILVTSINPTKAGEGKTTVSIGLADGLNQLNKNAVLALREPSLGPVMGLKGGATGGGYAQVVPMEDINLHFTGDFHALTSANNTLAALIDNHIQQGNSLNIDPRKILLRRVLDINDRALRNVVVGLGGSTSGVPREDHFDITVASELMAILCLSTSLEDLKNRINRMVIAKTYDNQLITVSDLHVGGAITTLLKDAIKPNLVQTLEHTPTIIHGGPFANIAHGCNSVLATKLALSLGDYAVTEAGFGADLGAEKFLDIKVPQLHKSPDATVIVATVKALKLHGTDDSNELNQLNSGLDNLGKHINSMQQYGLKVLVAINKFTDDSQEEIEAIKQYCQQYNVKAVVTDEWSQGGRGSIDLANALLELLADPVNEFKPLYKNDEDSIKDKINLIVRKIYGGKNVMFSKQALKQLKDIEKNGWDKLPVCMAKTPFSLSDDPNLIGCPHDFTIHVSKLEAKLGAGFIVVHTGKVLTMPGLPKHPAALDIDINNEGLISGLS
ncbi:MAG: formate--tetrahydrofolate ligase [Firmicutes bacterium]|uniref:Formate--tetrahydrofolate ligase n=1 Tax=Candidatus Gallilactobacillus intestinavium TaxID=2840838 RepID=A0A9D9E4A3_9LACO|nr:formate--tetrahydrofolate ligase [Candidatus Gallilactobacillus intestinavium]